MAVVVSFSQALIFSLQLQPRKLLPSNHFLNQLCSQHGITRLLYALQQLQSITVRWSAATLHFTVKYTLIHFALIMRPPKEKCSGNDLCLREMKLFTWSHRLSAGQLNELAWILKNFSFLLQFMWQNILQNFYSLETLKSDGNKWLQVVKCWPKACAKGWLTLKIKYGEQKVANF